MVRALRPSSEENLNGIEIKFSKIEIISIYVYNFVLDFDIQRIYLQLEKN